MSSPAKWCEISCRDNEAMLDMHAIWPKSLLWSSVEPLRISLSSEIYGSEWRDGRESCRDSTAKNATFQEYPCFPDSKVLWCGSMRMILTRLLCQKHELVLFWMHTLLNSMPMYWLLCIDLPADIMFRLKVVHNNDLPQGLRQKQPQISFARKCRGFSSITVVFLMLPF